ncbi:Cellulase domain-containing protein, partial [Cephalotus follicularis]
LFTLLTFLLLFPIFMSCAKPAMSVPLSTDSRFFVDQHGHRVKLACVNWASHLETMVAEGLSKQPMDTISAKIASMGFNCVRFTYATFMLTNTTLGNLTVEQSFLNNNLNESLAGIKALNPSILHLPVIEVFKRVVASMGRHNVMVILDNHISKPGWCCSLTDGNGFFGDEFFDPDVWQEGLVRMATMFKGVPNVVGMSLRNEPRGDRQDVELWFKYFERAAEAVHKANPDVLILLSGLDYAIDLTFLRNRSLNLSFDRKLGFEFHRYGFTKQNDWKGSNPNQMCGQVVNELKNTSLFMLDKGYPLFVSEFGADLRGNNENDNRFLNCFLGVMAEYDMDFALWTLFGSYYLRQGNYGIDEVYAVLNWNWCGLRNATYSARYSSIQPRFQVPGLPEAYKHKIIYHPQTGLCVLRNSLSMDDPLVLGPCNESEAWSYNTQNILSLKESYMCLQAKALGEPARLGEVCKDPSSKWKMISDSKMHLWSEGRDGSSVCLDVDSSNTIVTNDCKCLADETDCDPASQWFKLVDRNKF